MQQTTIVAFSEFLKIKQKTSKSILQQTYNISLNLDNDNVSVSMHDNYRYHKMTTSLFTYRIHNIRSHRCVQGINSEHAFLPNKQLLEVTFKLQIMHASKQVHTKQSSTEFPTQHNPI